MKALVTTAALAMALGGAVPAVAQDASPAPAPSAAAPAPGPVGPTLQPSPAATSTSGSRSTVPGARAPVDNDRDNGNGNGNGDGRDKGNGRKPLDHVKHLQSGTLSLSQVRWALTHQVQVANDLRKAHNVSFTNLRVYKLSSALKSRLKVGDVEYGRLADSLYGPGVLVAQLTLPTTNGSNSPLAILQNALANINVSNALNNVSVLNNSTVNVGITLSDVLNANKISIGQVLGVFYHSGGIITTITG